MGKTLENIMRCAAGTAVVGLSTIGVACGTLASVAGGYAVGYGAQNGEIVPIIGGLAGILAFGGFAVQTAKEIPAIIRTYTGRESYNGRR